MNIPSPGQLVHLNEQWSAISLFVRDSVVIIEINIDMDSAVKNVWLEHLHHVHIGLENEPTMERQYTKLRTLAFRELDSVCAVIPPDLHTVAQSLADGATGSNHAGYEYDQKNNFLLRHPEAVIQMSQLSSTCFLHAAAVTQYYAQVTARANAINRAAECIDTIGFIRSTYSAHQLYQFISADKPVRDSRSALQLMAQEGTVISNCHGSETEEIIRCFKVFGPGLIAKFNTTAEFAEVGKFYFLDFPVDAEVTGRQSMVLVGWRRDPVHGVVFHVQTWWKGKQFAHVSADYLSKSMAQVSNTLCSNQVTPFLT
jgi:hypothetical protein